MTKKKAAAASKAKGVARKSKTNRNQFTQAFIAALAQDFDAHGVKTIVSVRTEKPEAYLRLCAATLVKKVNVALKPLEQLPDEDLIKRIGEIDARIDALVARKVETENGAGAQDQVAQAAVLPTLH